MAIFSAQKQPFLGYFWGKNQGFWLPENSASHQKPYA